MLMDCAKHKCVHTQCIYIKCKNYLTNENYAAYSYKCYKRITNPIYFSVIAPVIPIMMYVVSHIWYEDHSKIYQYFYSSFILLFCYLHNVSNLRNKNVIFLYLSLCHQPCAISEEESSNHHQLKWHYLNSRTKK